MMRRESMGQDLADRHKIEEAFHDAKAIQGVDDFYGFGALSLADGFLFRSLGDLRGKRLLEIGCGDGVATVRFAKAGARVTAIDISGEMVELTRRVARDHGVSEHVEATKMGGEDIDFPEGTFDLVFGHSILHHLNLDVAGPRMVHVLRPGGTAAFLEPLDYNPVLNVFRKLTPWRRTPTEQPLRWEQLESFARGFSSWHHEEFYLFSLAAFFWYYGIKNRRLFTATQGLLSRLDEKAFALLPPLRRFAWITVVRFVR
jgi:SAM-dependent methyltransferase